MDIFILGAACHGRRNYASLFVWLRATAAIWTAAFLRMGWMNAALWRRFKQVFILGCGVAAVTVAAFALAWPAEPSSPDRWHILADEIHYDRKLDEYIAKGNVSISKQNRKLTADYVRYNKTEQKAYASGNAYLQVDKDILSGDSMELDLEKETGIIHKGVLYIHANQFHIRADTLYKTGIDSYVAQDASVTTCDGDNPDWRISGTDVDVTLEQYGYIYHAALWAKKLPLLYSPFMMFPVKRKRQSGFLVPLYGYSSRRGNEFEVPYFWAISESSDATLYGHFMSERGMKYGSEYRIVLDKASKGTLKFDYLNDRRIDDGPLITDSGGKEKSTSEWGYHEDDYLRTNQSRSWFRMKHDQALPFDMIAQIDGDIVSDQDYLLEFKKGYNSFDETNNYFFSTFGRGLDDYTDVTRTNRLNVKKLWNSYSLNAEVNWTDDIVKRRWAEKDDTLQKLPYIQFTGAKQAIGESGFFWDINSEYNHFYRINGTKGHRGDMHPRVYYPYTFDRYFTFEPSIGGRATVWYVNEYDPSQEKEDQTFNREHFDLKLDLTSEVYNIFTVERLGIDRIKHSVRPQIVYDYIPEKDQSDLPAFSGDVIEEQNLLTYSITNSFTSRSLKEKIGSEEGGDKPEYDYREFCYFKLSQSFDIKESYEKDGEPFQPIIGEIEFYPASYLSLDATSQWCVYESRFIDSSLSAKMWDHRGDQVQIEHNYKLDDAASIAMEGEIVLTSRIKTFGRFERNLKDRIDIEKMVGLRYTTQCWYFEVTGSENEDEIRYQFMVNLIGLGEFGSTVSNPYGN